MARPLDHYLVETVTALDDGLDYANVRYCLIGALVIEFFRLGRSGGVGTLPFSCPFRPRRIEYADLGREVGGRQVRVAHHHPKAPGAEQFGDRPEGRALHHEPRGERVPQIKPGNVLDLRGFERHVKAVLDVLDRLASLPPTGVREHVWTARDAPRG
jgi:hypothetical protein